MWGRLLKSMRGISGLRMFCVTRNDGEHAAGTNPVEEDACHQVFHPRRGRARQPHGRADGQLEPAIVAGLLAPPTHIYLSHDPEDVWQERTGQAGCKKWSAIRSQVKSQPAQILQSP